MTQERNYTSFIADKIIVSGDLKTMLTQTKRIFDDDNSASILIFDDQTGDQIDFDFRGTLDDVFAGLSSHPMFAARQDEIDIRTGPGRPKLGVVSREITLLPRHWDWLNRQSGGASVTLRKLVEDSMKRGQKSELSKNAWDAVGKFMWNMAGNLPNFEEASRALYSKNNVRLTELIHDWPNDIRAYIAKLLQTAKQYDE